MHKTSNRIPAVCNPAQVKRLIKALESARGNGTSMISLILPPKDQASVTAQQQQQQV
jgi:peptide chain release factor subunit 1